jgi:NTP pyrophosphatase (non-canonical NTP hydrolase)
MMPYEYQKLAERTECDQLAARNRYAPDMDGENLIAIRVNHALLGISSELGELATTVERWLHYGQGLDCPNVKEELGDILWYVALACNAMGFDLGVIMEANIAKLKARYPDRYDDQRALECNRDRSAERQAMEDQCQR